MTLWISLEGSMVTTPRADKNPYLQLDVDVTARPLTVWEGDMWDKRGASRRTEPITLDELKTETLTQRVVDVLRRAVEHGADCPGDVG